MTFIHNKLRNRMSTETMDKLVFIYMNMRTLRHMRGEKDWDSEQWEEIKEDILLNIEDEMVVNNDERDA